MSKSPSSSVSSLSKAGPSSSEYVGGQLEMLRAFQVSLVPVHVLAEDMLNKVKALNSWAYELQKSLEGREGRS